MPDNKPSKETNPPGPPELVDNVGYGSHEEALKWLSEQYSGPLNVATAYVGLEGLDTLARLVTKSSGSEEIERLGESGRRDGNAQPARLLIGATPSAEQLTRPGSVTIAELFEQSKNSLKRQRDFSAFPAARRAVLERVWDFIASDRVEVRRYQDRFLHGKAYIIAAMAEGERRVTEDDGRQATEGAALVSSANLTKGGLVGNLELGVVNYQSRVVALAMEWYEGLWDDGLDFKRELLDLLNPPPLEGDPQDVFLRALLELYEGDLDPEARPGDGKLADFQRDGFVRARRILERYGGVLFADGVGMGKTEIGLKFVREYARKHGWHVLIISPAQLRDDLWKRRLAEANLPGKVVSYQELARDPQLSDNGGRRALPVEKDVYRLVIIDEAHAYRNTGNTWYAALDRLMGGTSKKLLLLTATPVNNSLWDLHNLFLLFGRHDGAFAGDPLKIPSLRHFFRDAGASAVGRISETKLFRLIDALTVRRDRAFIEEQYQNKRFPDGTPVKFPKPELHQRRYDLDSVYPGIVNTIADGVAGLTMVRYRLSAYRVDTADSAVSEDTLAGLIQSSILKRFESSWYSALRTVKRMQRASELVLRSLEEEGRVPPPKVIGDLAGEGDDAMIDAASFQKALAKYEDGMAGEEWVAADGFRENFSEDLKKDLGILTRMVRELELLGSLRDPKVDALKEIMASTPSQKVAIFTGFQDTAEYLRGRIENDQGLLGDRRWTVVAGSATDADARMQALQRFCPKSVGGPRGRSSDDGGEVDVLLSTDVLSEGQNLQQAQAVLSFDMPWNPQRVVQRNGRVIRLHSPHETAYLYTLLPKKGDLDSLLKLEAKLQAKIQAANAAVGMETQVLKEVSAESQIYADLAGFVDRLSKDDRSLLDEAGVQEDGAAFAGELFRAYIQRAAEEGEVKRLMNLPWGMGAAFASRSEGVDEPAVFFACRTRADERYWRVVSRSGEILHRDDLPMLRLIDPEGEAGCPIPGDLDLDRLFAEAADDICKDHNALVDDPTRRTSGLPASQRWVLEEILRSPDAPLGDEYDSADEALSAGRNNLVLRALSKVRREYEAGGMSVTDCARRILEVVERFGLRPVEQPKIPTRISADDLGVVCYQVVLPRG